MATDTDKKKSENKGEKLIHEVFSWSLDDVLNKNFYKSKVCIKNSHKLLNLTV